VGVKTWCRHIKWQCGIAEDRWQIGVRGWSGQLYGVPVPHSWRVCPICEAERPTRANIAAATNRALQDAGDEE